VIVPIELRAAPPELSRESQNAAALAEIRRLALRGSKIAAVRLYLDTFGGGLKQAKDAVDAMARP
jgi:ribosomal protein L7/L12